VFAYDRPTSLKNQPSTSRDFRDGASSVNTANGTVGSLLALSSAMLRKDDGAQGGNG
jgi:hypothetical protein